MSILYTVKAEKSEIIKQAQDDLKTLFGFSDEAYDNFLKGLRSITEEDFLKLKSNLQECFDKHVYMISEKSANK